MQRKFISVAGTIAILALLAVACSGTNAAPNRTPNPLDVQRANAGPNPEGGFRGAPTTTLAPAANSSQPAPTNTSSNSFGELEPQTVEGGSVSVAVTPIDLKAGAPADFEIAMNTHSVDLSADMLKSVLLRDDAGKEYAPTKWDGPDGGGHHRSGRIEFPTLPGNVNSVTLIVKDIAGIPERDFKWDVPQ